MYKKEKLIEALHAQQAGLNEKADTLYRSLLNDCPKAWDVHQKYAIFLISQGKRDLAIHHFRLIAEANQNHAPTHANLGSALSENEDYEAAILELEKALALDGRLVQARLVLLKVYLKTEHFKKAVDTCNLLLDQVEDKASIYFMAGMAVRGLNEDIDLEGSCFKKAVQLDMHNFQYHLHYAISLHRQKSYCLAETEFKEALKLNPNSLEAEVCLFELFIDLDRLEDADALIKLSIRKNSNNPELFDRQAMNLVAMNKHLEAIKSYETALKLDSKREISHIGLAECYGELGEVDQALKYVEKTFKLDPRYEAPYYLYSIFKKVDITDPYINKTLDLINELGPDNPLTTSLHFALGKMYDDCGEWDCAFKHYLNANNLAKLVYPYDYDYWELLIDNIIEIFSKDFIKNYTGYVNLTTKPIFIVGMPRSGTTLTEQIVASHHQVGSAGEVVFWTEFNKKSNSKLPFPQSILSMETTTIKKIADEYLHRLDQLQNESQQNQFLTDKLPHNFLYLGLLALLFPNVHFIHCKRDPMDICLSNFFQYFNFRNSFSFDLRALGHHYKQYERLMNHWQRMFPDRIFDVRYEDLVTDNEAWSRKMISFLGLDWDEACLSRNKKGHVVRTASKWQIRQSLNKSSMLRWKNYEKHLGPLKAALGLEDH